MSDLDATRTRGQSAPVSNLAQGRLQSLSGRRVGIAGNEEALDAFSEVFARMAVSTSQVAGPPEASDEAPTNPVDTGQEKDRESTDDSWEAASDDDRISGERSAIRGEIEAIDTSESDWIAGAAHAQHVHQQNESPSIDTVDALGVEGPATTQTNTVSAIDQPGVEGEGQPIDGLPGHRHTNVSHQGTGDESAVRNDASGPQRSVEHDAAARTVDEQDLKSTDGLTEAETTLDSDDRSRRRSRRHRVDSTPAGNEKQATEQAAARPASTPSTEQAIAASENQSSHLRTDAATPTKSPNAPAATAAGAANQNVVSGSGKSTTTSNTLVGRPNGGTPFNTELAPAQVAKPASNASGKGSAKAAASEVIDRVKLVQRVTKAFQHLGPDGGVVRLRLAPAELGSVRVEMRIDGRKMDARVVAETEAASSVLREHLPDLRQRLESFGMQIERLEIETDSRDADRGDSRPGHRQQGDATDGQGQHRSPNGPTPEPEPVSRAVSPREVPLVPSPNAANVGVGVDLIL